MLPAACIVPESSARPGWVAPLVALFSPLVHLCPVPETMPQEGRLLALSPPMPAAATEKLGHLARSLAGSEAIQHGEQLKQLILESLNPENDQEESSALRQQLHTGRRENTDSSPAPATELLWQERLLLLLADQAECQQEELARAMSRISRQHQELLSSLGDSQEEALENLLPPKSVSSLTTWQPKRLQAWARLLARTTMPRQDIWYITRQEGLAAQILEQHQLCEHCTQGQAQRLPELLLPAYTPDTQHESAAPRVQDCPGLFAAFSGLHTLARDGVTESGLQQAASLFAEAVPIWNDMIRAATPADAGLCHLRLNILPGTTFLQRLHNSFACSPASVEAAGNGKGEAQALCLFGLLLGGAQEDGIRA